MHFSAKRGLAIVCRLSVCLSVGLWRWWIQDCDHVGWNSSKIISWLVSVGRSLSADPNIRGLLQGEQQEIRPKVTHRSYPLLIWASEILDRKLRPNGYRYCNGHNGEPPSLFRMVSYRWPPTASRSTQIEVPYAPRYTLHDYSHISATGDPIHFMFGRVWFSGSADRMALFPVTSNPSWWQAAILDNFEWPHLRNGSFDPLI